MADDKVGFIPETPACGAESPPHIDVLAVGAEPPVETSDLVQRFGSISSQRSDQHGSVHRGVWPHVLGPELGAPLVCQGRVGREYVYVAPPDPGQSDVVPEEIRHVSHVVARGGHVGVEESNDGKASFASRAP
jgi:hypothetical protein